MGTNSNSSINKEALLKSLKTRSQIISESISSDLLPDILKVMEAVRLQNGLTLLEFSDILEFSDATYRRALAGNADIKASALIRFCYVFGYDLQSIFALSKVYRDKDISSVKVSAFVESLSDKFLLHIAEDAFSNNELTKWQYYSFVDAINQYSTVRKKANKKMQEQSNV